MRYGVEQSLDSGMNAVYPTESEHLVRAVGDHGKRIQFPQLCTPKSTKTVKVTATEPHSALAVPFGDPIGQRGEGVQ